MKQRLKLASGTAYGAQQKVLRLMREAAAGLGRILLPHAGDDASTTDINVIESYSGFTPYGDLVSHLGVVWKGALEEGVDATNTPMDTQIIPMLQAFTADMKARGVTVLISHTPIIRRYYMQHRESIDRLHETMAHAAPLTVTRPPSEFVFDASQMFDTVYHLNKEGRRLRSEMVAEDIIRRTGACLGKKHETTAGAVANAGS
jgi:hypothetical protein